MILNDEYEDKYGQMSMKKNEKYYFNFEICNKG